ncbi:unnamed protein product [Soboliphyme baturini]|uniref:Uncharacterized protein n=1 Tax=Soboliphyme baturini TaxID=241478 RepID=A0A183IWV3_9BILA|nr:unnamed protein product [Soboliphyme baturini]
MRPTTPPLPVPSTVEKEGLKLWRSPRQISRPASHGTDVFENYTDSVVARGANDRASCCGTEAGCEESPIRTCSSSSASRGRSSTTTADEDRRNDDEDISQQRSRYPFLTEADSARPL